MAEMLHNGIFYAIFKAFCGGLTIDNNFKSRYNVTI